MLLFAAAGLLLAAALALGFSAGWDAPLGGALYRYDPALLNVSQAVIQRYLSPGLWDHAVLPVLEWPSWVVPAALGLLLLGLQGLLARRRRRAAAVSPAARPTP